MQLLLVDWRNVLKFSNGIIYDVFFFLFQDKYRQKLEENLSLDSEGRPFKILVFRGSPKSSRKSLRLIDEMRRNEEEAFNYTNNVKQYRFFPKVHDPFAV